jgi:surfeit locus 1 family protein
MTFRPALWPTVFSLPAFLVLLGLGTWQVDRLHWKERLLAERHAAVAAPPIELPRSLDEARGLEFRHVRVRGTFRHDKELYLAATSDLGTIGKHVLTPLVFEDGRVVLVNRGFVPDERKDPSRRQAGQVTGIVEVDGLLRLPPERKPVWFVPDNNPDRNFWFWVDLPAMARAAGIDGVLPFYVDAGSMPNPGGWPRGGVTRIELPNDHLQYAITWYSLAIALAVIYVLYHRRKPEAAP